MRADTGVHLYGNLFFLRHGDIKYARNENDPSHQTNLPGPEGESHRRVDASGCATEMVGARRATRCPSWRWTLKSAENTASRCGRRRENRFYLNGAFVEIRPPERLVSTFRWERGEWGYPETLVSVDFYDKGDETTVTLTHEGFPDENMRDEHQRRLGRVPR